MKETKCFRKTNKTILLHTHSQKRKTSHKIFSAASQLLVSIGSIKDDYFRIHFYFRFDTPETAIMWEKKKKKQKQVPNKSKIHFDDSEEKR